MSSPPATKWRARQPGRGVGRDSAEPPLRAASTPDTAGIANAFRPTPAPDTAAHADTVAAPHAAPAAAARNRCFTAVYGSPNRSAPLAPVVSELWGVPSATRTGARRKPVAGGMLDLFKDLVSKRS